MKMMHHAPPVRSFMATRQKLARPSRRVVCQERNYFWSVRYGLQQLKKEMVQYVLSLKRVSCECCRGMRKHALPKLSSYLVVRHHANRCHRNYFNSTIRSRHNLSRSLPHPLAGTRQTRQRLQNSRKITIRGQNSQHWCIQLCRGRLPRASR